MEFFLVMMFLGSAQPVALIIYLGLVTVLYSYMVFKVSGGYWFGYALVLVVLSGVLVIFTYMASMTPNESFEGYGLIFILIFILGLGVCGVFFYFNDMSYLSMNLWGWMMGGFSLFFVFFLLGVMMLVIWVGGLGEGAVRLFLGAW